MRETESDSVGQDGPRTMVVSTPEQGTVDLWSRADERSLINLVPGSLAEPLMAASKSNPDLFQMDERTLYKSLREQNMQPTPTDNRLRLAFWNEYDRAQANHKSMDMVAVFAGVCHKSYFFGRYITRPEKLAWLVCPPASYEVVATEALSYGLEQMREILSLPIKDAQGRVNVKLGELQAKIVVMLDQRLKGGFTQRLESKSMQLSISTSDAQVAKAAAQGSMEEIERRIKELERRERKALHLAEGAGDDGGKEAPIDVESHPVTG